MAQVILTMNAQLKVLERLINKRSLVGCYPIGLPGEPIGPDSEYKDDGNGSQMARQDHMLVTGSRLVATMLVLSQVSL